MVFNFIETIKFNKNFGVCYAGIKVFNYLPTSIKSIASDTEVFKKTLKRFLMDNSFYSVDEFINFKE